MKRAVVLARLRDEDIGVARARAASELLAAGADDEGRIALRGEQHMTEHGRGRTFAMRACDRDARAVVHQPAEHLGVFDDADVAFERRDHFRVILPDGRGNHDDIALTRKRIGVLFKRDRNARSAEVGDGVGVIEVGAGADRPAARGHACESGHAAAADADEMQACVAKLKRVAGNGAVRDHARIIPVAGNRRRQGKMTSPIYNS